MERTIQQLRKLCAFHGITLQIRNYSYGYHAVFKVDGISSNAVNFPANKIKIVNNIKKDFQGLKKHGQHIYGLKRSANDAALAAHIRCYDV